MSDDQPTEESTGGTGASFDFSISLGAKIGELTDELREDRAERLARQEAAMALQPIEHPAVGGGNYPTSGVLMLDLLAPAPGRVWELRSLAVGGALSTSTPAGSAYLFATAFIGAALDLSLVNMRDYSTLSFPQIAFYSARQMVFRGGEHLVVVIQGGTAGVGYAASAKILDYPERPYNETSGL